MKHDTIDYVLPFKYGNEFSICEMPVTNKNDETKFPNYTFVSLVNQTNTQNMRHTEIYKQYFLNLEYSLDKCLLGRSHIIDNIELSLQIPKVL